ncbi:hypothetical protein NDU88_005072 [Pleurodeles waltl]|uniref:Uncharacterized protein n=1 Tax=Pleurodeles waltl TaxID=8319 RepID=A0AAV7LLR8_PLEWA|nr:hypothetical protein NDU88_005072 [Pleurodeles waltl]
MLIGLANDLEHTLVSCTEDQKVLWCKIANLEDQQIDLQMKQEDLKNRSRRNIYGIPRGMESADIMTFSTGLLHTIRGDSDASSPMLDRVHRVASALGRPDFTLDILSWVHFFTEKATILQTSWKKADLVFRGLTIQLFQDLAPTTFQRHRDLRPITNKLQELNICYQ